MSDSTTRDFRAKIESGARLPFYTMTYSCLTTTESPGVMTWWDSSGARKRTTTGCVTQFLYGTPAGVAGAGFTKLSVALPSSISITNLIAEAKAQALQKFSSSEQSFREPVAEIGKTLRTIRRPFQAIRRVVKRFSEKKASYKTKLKAKDAADLWLGYSVNVAPNVGTINDAIDAFARRNYKRWESQKEFTKLKSSSGPLRASAMQTPSLGGLKTAMRIYELEVTATIEFSNSMATSVREQLGLSLRSAPGLVWELIPLSFMIDRMLNIKRFIDVSSALLSGSMRINQAWTVVRIDDLYVRSVKNLTVSGSPNPSPRDSPNLYERDFSYSRTRWSPTSFDVVPSFKAGGLLQALHSTLDAVSLTISRLT